MGNILKKEGTPTTPDASHVNLHVNAAGALVARDSAGDDTELATGKGTLTQEITMNLAEIKAGTGTESSKAGVQLPDDALITGVSFIMNTGISGGGVTTPEAKAGDATNPGFIQEPSSNFDWTTAGRVQAGVDDPLTAGVVPITPLVTVTAVNNLDNITAGDLKVIISYVLLGP